MAPTTRGQVDVVISTLLSLENRIRSEFLEMPGLHLTTQQASRLWALDQKTSQHVLDRLKSTGFLAQTSTGAYFRRSMG
jgi:hypothetical protein